MDPGDEPVTQKNTCKTCRYWYEGLGECRIRSVETFPERQSLDWCGEHRVTFEEEQRIRAEFQDAETKIRNGHWREVFDVPQEREEG
jgi:hypothetical protein